MAAWAGRWAHLFASHLQARVASALSDLSAFVACSGAVLEERVPHELADGAPSEVMTVQVGASSSDGWERI